MAEPFPVSDELPLRPSAFAVLAALAPGPRTGIEILDEVAKDDESIREADVVFRVLRELVRLGWIERAASPPDEPGSEDRSRHHTLTSEGRAVLEAEAWRIRRALDRARAPGPSGR